MPLPKAKGHSKKAINKQVGKNIHELVHHGTKKRSHAQIVAIAENTAKGEKEKVGGPLIVRHAEVESNKTGKMPSEKEKLTPEGENQAKELGKTFKKKGILSVIASGSNRTMQTAKIAVAESGKKMPIKIDRRLKEYDPEKEDLQDGFERVKEVWKDLQKLGPNTAVVAHKNIMKMLEALDKTGGKIKDAMREYKNSKEYGNTEAYEKPEPLAKGAYQGKVNDLIDEIKGFNKLPKNAADRKDRLNAIKLKANDLGLTFDDTSGKLFNERGNPVQTRSATANKTVVQNFKKEDYRPDTHTHVATIVDKPEILTGLPIMGEDGRRLSDEQKAAAIKSIQDGKVNLGGKAIYDFIENAVKEGKVTIEDLMLGKEMKIPIDDYFAAFKEPIKPLEDADIEILNSQLGEDEFKNITDNINDFYEPEKQVPGGTEQEAARSAGEDQEGPGSDQETAGADQGAAPKGEGPDLASKNFNQKVDEAAEKIIDFLTPKSTKGAHTAGGDIKSLVHAAANIVKGAYQAGTDIKQAVEDAVQHIKDNWDKAWGALNEKGLRQFLGDITAPRREDTYTKEVQDLRSFAVRTPKFTANPHTDRKIIEGIRNSMILQSRNLIKSVPEKFHDPVLQENVYHHLEDPTVELTDDEKQFRDEYVIPIAEARQSVYDNVVGNHPELEDGMLNILERNIGFVPREVVGKRGTLERIKERLDKIKSDKGTGGSQLKTSSGHLKERVYKGITDAEGNREVVVLKNRKIFKPEDDGKTLTELGDYDGEGNFTDKSGKTYSVGDATVKEIEAGTKTRYYKTPLANNLNALIELKQVEMTDKFLSNMKDVLGSSGLMVDSKKGVPEGYATTELQNFRGYAFRKDIAAELNRLAYQSKSDLVPGIRTVNQFLRNAIVFGTGVKHWLNETDTWLKQGGVSRFAHPYRMVKAGMQAAHALLTQSPEYFEMMEHGASLMSQDTKNYHQLLLDSTQAFLKGKPRFLKYISDKLGYGNPLKLMKVLSEFSHKSAMSSHDFLMMQAVFEDMDKGHTLRESIDRVNKFIPDYDIPSTIAGSEGVSKFLRNPNYTMFSSYHYGLFNSYYNMLNDFIKSAKGMDAKGIAEATDKIAMTAILSAFIYPMMDALYNMTFTSDEDKKERQNRNYE